MSALRKRIKSLEERMDAVEARLQPYDPAQAAAAIRRDIEMKDSLTSEAYAAYRRELYLNAHPDSPLGRMRDMLRKDGREDAYFMEG